jgi:hypothetical protein
MEAANPDDPSTRRNRMTVQVDSGRVVVLCDRLADATRAGRAKWRVEGEDTFLWDGEQGSVSVQSRDKDGVPPYQLVVFNANGVKVEELTSQLLENDEPAEWNEPLAVLYRSARRSALNADEVTDALIEALP